MKKMSAILLTLSLSFAVTSCALHNEKTAADKTNEDISVLESENNKPDEAVMDETFEEAENEFEEENYLEAIEIYKEVTQDSPNYQTAQDRIKEANIKYIEYQINNADELVDKEEFDDAEKQLEYAMEIFSDNNELKDKYDEVISKHSGFILENVNAYILENDYLGAILYFDDNTFITSESVELQEKFEEVKQKYISAEIKKADELVKTGDYDEAISQLNDVPLSIVEKSYDLQSKITELESSKPVNLGDMKLTNSDHFYSYTVEDGGVSDTTGNIYSPTSTHKIAYSRYNSSHYKRGNGYAEIYLGKDYTILSGTVAISDESEDCSGRFEIYSDDELIFYKDFGRKTTPFDIEIDVSKTEWLKIQVTNGTEGDLGVSVALLNNFVFHK